jgi:uncharacterized protein (DUF1501 family)
MLTIYSGGRSTTCDGISRRSFLTAGTLALGGLTLSDLLRAAGNGEKEPKYLRDRAVVLVFLGGGASHIETFNPNMGAPEPYCSLTGEVKTNVPGITLGGTFPLLAKHADKLAIVRSFRHSVGNHDQAISHVLTGGTDPTGQKTVGFSMGSMYARLRGSNHPRTGLPTYTLLTNPHKDPQYSRELQRVTAGSRSGPLGPGFAPFTLATEGVPPAAGKPGGKGAAGGDPLRDNMILHLPAEQLEARRAMLGKLDTLKRRLDGVDLEGSLDPFEEKALNLLLGGATKAFDLSAEKPATLARYDTSSFKCGKKVFEPSALGRQFLLARRLIEAGAGFVTVQSAGWDMHADVNNPGMKDGMEMLGRPLDRALAAFMDDITERGMLEKVLVVVTGDFGRTPKVNARGGRDHWPNLCTLAFLGGGIKGGQVIGKSDRTNAKPDSTPYSTGNLLSTVLHALLDVGTLRVTRNAPANLVKLLEDNKPIEELF